MNENVFFAGVIPRATLYVAHYMYWVTTRAGDELHDDSVQIKYLHRAARYAIENGGDDAVLIVDAKNKRIIAVDDVSNMFVDLFYFHHNGERWVVINKRYAYWSALTLTTEQEMERNQLLYTKIGRL